MRELAILSWVTVDGVMQAPMSAGEDTSGGFSRGGWAAPHWDTVMEQVRREAMAAPYDVLFGRKTYELFAAHYPAEEDHPMNTATKYVATSSPAPLAWRNSIQVDGDLPAAILRLKEEEGPLLQVHGSSNLIQTLLAHDLIDEFRIWTFPVVVGSGKRLFAVDSPQADLKLIKADTGPTGVSMTIYRRATE